jgi:hypothetical protein
MRPFSGPEIHQRARSSGSICVHPVDLRLNPSTCKGPGLRFPLAAGRGGSAGISVLAPDGNRWHARPSRPWRRPTTVSKSAGASWIRRPRRKRSGSASWRADPPRRRRMPIPWNRPVMPNPLPISIPRPHRRREPRLTELLLLRLIDVAGGSHLFLQDGRVEVMGFHQVVERVAVVAQLGIEQPHQQVGIHAAVA